MGVAVNQSRLSIQGATDEILRRQAGRANAQAGATYGRIQAPSLGDLAALRRQQAQFARTSEDLDRRNNWMAIPALAPAAAVLALEGAGMLTAGGAATGAAGAPGSRSLCLSASSGGVMRGPHPSRPRGRATLSGRRREAFGLARTRIYQRRISMLTSTIAIPWNGRVLSHGPILTGSPISGRCHPKNTSSPRQSGLNSGAPSGIEHRRRLR
jgi:hypothetical protein